MKHVTMAEKISKSNRNKNSIIYRKTVHQFFDTTGNCPETWNCSWPCCMYASLDSREEKFQFLETKTSIIYQLTLYKTVKYLYILCP
jgi:hypothetical protein